MKKNWTLLLALFILAASVWSRARREASDGSFPRRPVAVYVGFAAGGGTDVLVRRLARGMEEVLEQPVLVVNKPGGGGLVALKELITRKPDGYTLGVLLGNQFLQKHHRGSESWIDPLEDVAVLGVFNRDPWGIAVAADAPYDDLRGFIDHARKNPGLRVGSGGPGTVYYWTWAWLMDREMIDLTVVPFGGTAPALTALAGGELVAAGASPSEADSLMQAGLIKMIGIAAGERMAAYPRIRTFAEDGLDMVIGPWRALVGPAGIPDERARILEEALRAACHGEPFQAFIQAQGFGAFFLAASDSKAFLESEDRFFFEVIERAGELRRAP